MKTADVLNLPYRNFLEPKRNKGKEPETIIVLPTKPDIPVASTSSPKDIAPSSISSSESVDLVTKHNITLNEAESAKRFPNRTPYREYKVLDSNVENWAKTPAVKLSANKQRISFQVPSELTFSDSISDKADDPATFQRIFNIKMPTFSGNVEDADDFVYHFYDYLHHFAHPPNEEYLATAFISCLPLDQRNYFTKQFLPARGLGSDRITIPFKEVIAQFQKKFATYTIEEA
ncbi:hypothetical protein H8356DRAFT_1278088 [Neocallimastix lanati (nom. inval.)]|uniref:Uncharacterized protein n=1 Tax=Neocallimastix californiae TaxID=1754190 RepID=A0A1Y2AHA9_9FUNG|nr:hypothetical protein H8356DRAFT_1278088 [Neocallimastix sp. JGI-2020a]ORY21963.1 hypothetical protein LY90DRAFT_515784 [Neocallimastix californiae]|eukprot:ORY21963.1 hypothetical protein LY90DRAFT_515784 [Neocallimastix californiae]